jgi:hypothetical protein
LLDLNRKGYDFLCLCGAYISEWYLPCVSKTLSGFGKKAYGIKLIHENEMFELRKEMYHKYRLLSSDPQQKIMEQWVLAFESLVAKASFYVHGGFAVSSRVSTSTCMQIYPTTHVTQVGG